MRYTKIQRIMNKTIDKYEGISWETWKGHRNRIVNNMHMDEKLTTTKLNWERKQTIILIQLW